MPTPYEELVAREEKFLTAAGWTKVAPDRWLEPEACGWDRRELPFGHAFNSEWAHGRERETHTRAERYAIVRQHEVYLLESGWTMRRGDDVAEGKLPDEWTEPPGRHDKQYVFRNRGRAVNSQKQWDRLSGRIERDGET